MKLIGNIFIYLTGIISFLFGIEYFVDFSVLLLVGIFYFIGYRIKHYFSHRNYKISQRSKLLHHLYLRSIFLACINIILFIFFGYAILLFSKTDFYLTHLQSLTQNSIDLIDTILSFWMNLPNRLLRYGH